MSARRYGLFVKENGRWVRLHPDRSYPKPVAIRVFQTELLSLTFSGKEPGLRPLPRESRAIPAPPFGIGVARSVSQVSE